MTQVVGCTIPSPELGNALEGRVLVVAMLLDSFIFRRFLTLGDISYFNPGIYSDFKDR